MNTVEMRDHLDKIAELKPDSLSPVEKLVELYLDESYEGKRVLCLVGPTATAKSSIIKHVAHKKNQRVVDIRVAFMSRLDIEGLMERHTDTSRIESFNAGHNEFVECSDEYLEFVRSSLPIIEEAIKNAKSVEEVNLYSTVYENYKEKAKTPVLFFDEITRSDANIRNAIMSLLVEKRLLDLNFTKARIVAATNHPLTDDAEASAIYLTDEVLDDAFLNRLHPVQVHSHEMKNAWIDWASDNLHPVVVDYVKSHSKAYYSMTSVFEKVAKSGDFNDFSVTPFPNFRSWDFVSKYLNHNERAFNGDVISGLIGDEAKDFCEYLTSVGYTDATPKNKNLNHLVESSLDARIPLLMVTPSSIGKSARVYDYAKKVNAEVIQINLATQDRVDIMGPPVKVDLVSKVAGLYDEDLGHLGNELVRNLARFNLPTKVTVKAPKRSYSERLRKAEAENRPVILFFDEMNRVSNETLMAAVFEAISDNRFAGISFGKADVSIVSACNLGETNMDASRLDPAFAARFCVHYQSAYQDDDVLSYLDYAENPNSNYHPHVLAYLQSRSIADLKTALASIEKSTITESASSSRSFEDLSHFLNSMANDNLFTGILEFSVPSSAYKVSDVFNRTHPDVAISFNSLGSCVLSDRWAGHAVPGAEKLPEIYKSIKEQFAQDKVDPETYTLARSFLTAISTIESQVTDRRDWVVTSILGKAEGKSFLSYYNAISGRVVSFLSIEDVKDIAKAQAYVSQEFSKESDYSQLPNLSVELLVRYSKAFPKVDLAVVRSMISAMISMTPSTDLQRRTIQNMSSNVVTTKLLVQAEENITWAMDLLATMGNPISKDQWEEKKNSINPGKRSNVIQWD